MKRMVFCCLATAVLAGCGVSKDIHKAALDESEARRIQLENKRQELEEARKALDKVGKDLEVSRQENEKLRKEMDQLKESMEKEVSSLKGRIEELSGRGIMTSKEIEALKQDRESLASSEKAKGEEIAALRQQMDNLAKGKEFLSREIERLQVKTGEISSEKEKELANVKRTYENLVKEMQSEIEKGDIKITQAVDRLSVNLVEKILFDSGKAEVKPEGLKVLKRVGDILKNVSDRQIRIEGHTDNVKISARLREKFPTNWELSTARASNVVRYLQDKVGIDPKFLSAAGFSEYKPLAGNDSDEGRAQNRRIEIVLLPLDVDRVLEELKK